MKKILLLITLVLIAILTSACSSEAKSIEPFGKGYISSNADECVEKDGGIETCLLTYKGVQFADSKKDIKFTIDVTKGSGEENNLNIYLDDKLIHTVEGVEPSIENLDMFNGLLVIHTHGGTEAFQDNLYAFDSKGKDILNYLPYENIWSYFKSYTIDENKIVIKNTRIGNGTEITTFDIYKYDEEGNKTECYSEEEFYRMSGLRASDLLYAITEVRYLKSGSFTDLSLIGSKSFDTEKKIDTVEEYIRYLCD